MKEIASRDVPQANDLHTICDLIALVNEGIEAKETLTAQLVLVSREIEYYKHAARILGFAHFEPPDFWLTENGKRYLRGVRSEQKRALLARAVREAEIFRELLSELKDREPTKDNVTEFLIRRTALNRTTARRRANTIIAWLKQTSDWSTSNKPF
jgi:hypothetical protein